MGWVVFDVFGTCTDWRGSVIRQIDAVARAKALTVDSSTMTDEWRREGYFRGIARSRAGETPYVSSDDLFRGKLDELLPRFGLSGLTEAEKADLAHAWRRLDPWPDTVPGLLQLKRKFTISTLSNGSFSPLTTMGKRAGMPWGRIIPTDPRRTLKPQSAAHFLC